MLILTAYLITALILALSFGIIPMSTVYTVAVIAAVISAGYALTSSIMTLAR